MFATRRSRSCRRTNRLFRANSPNRTRRTMTSDRPGPDTFGLIINTARAYEPRGPRPPDAPGRPDFRGRLHLREPRPRRRSPLRPHSPVDRRGIEGYRGPDLADPDDRDGRVLGD